jgi:hypothetical protein
MTTFEEANHDDAQNPNWQQSDVEPHPSMSELVVGNHVLRRVYDDEPPHAWTVDVEPTDRAYGVVGEPRTFAELLDAPKICAELRMMTVAAISLDPALEPGRPGVQITDFHYGELQPVAPNAEGITEKRDNLAHSFIELTADEARRLALAILEAVDVSLQVDERRRERRRQ